MWTLWSVVLAAIVATIFARLAASAACGRCGMSTDSTLAGIRWPRPFAGLQGLTWTDVPREAWPGSPWPP